MNISIPRKSQLSVLVVDDHPNTATTLARAIAQLGSEIDVISANSGEKALELVQGKTVDLLITDMVMTGLNGLELIEKLQSHPGGRPAYIILITAYDLPGLKETARRLKVNDLIIKPVRPERICQVVVKAIEDLGRGQVVQPSNEKPQLKILIADDQPDNITLLSRYLLNEGYICISASNGVEALARMRAEVPDLVLLDVNMPVKDGFETLQEIRTDLAIGHIPVIFLTARVESMDMQAALNMGADDYVTKPFDRRELLARIRTRLRVKEAEDAIRRQNKELNLLPEIGKELSARLDIDELTDVVLRRTVETLGALLGHIVILTPEGSLKKTHHFSGTAADVTLPPLTGLLAQFRETRQGFIINDIHADTRWQVGPNDPTRSVIIVPLLGRFNLLGLLILAHEQKAYFSVEHKLLLQAIASQAAIAMENALMYENMAQQQERLELFVQNAAEAFFMFDADGRLVLINPAGEDLFPDGSVSLDQPLAGGPGAGAFVKILEQARRSGKLQTGEIVWPDQRTFTASISPVETGELVAVLHEKSEK
jgi:CheY-like chemotaxis protein